MDPTEMNHYEMDPWETDCREMDSHQIDLHEKDPREMDHCAMCCCTSLSTLQYTIVFTVHIQVQSVQRGKTIALYLCPFSVLGSTIELIHYAYCIAA